ncbi:restriction endonuclease [archaeon SCG-AAA382B04]|nr:restriction endonuclease [archaeon SCG-AAA382B04]
MSTQKTLTKFNNQNLFSTHYLEELVKERPEWDISKEEIKEIQEKLRKKFERRKSQFKGYTEGNLEGEWIVPVLEELDHSIGQQQTDRTGQQPDYAFFESDDVKYSLDPGSDEYYEKAVAVGDAKRWNRDLDKKRSDGKVFDKTNPSYQIDYYMRETNTDWGILTNGKKWRLYYTGGRLDRYYEVDLIDLLYEDPETFKYFYVFFRRKAFEEDQDGDNVLDKFYEGSTLYSKELGEELEENIYEAIRLLAQGFLEHDENNLEPDQETIKEIYDNSLIYLYRIIFILYAESRGLIDTESKIYRGDYGLITLKQDISDKIGTSEFKAWRDKIWKRLHRLFELIDEGSEEEGIPRDELFIPPYNGGLFDQEKHQFLNENKVADSYLAKVIDLLCRSESKKEGDRVFVDYSSLEVRHLGGIYEELLEHELNYADEPMVAAGKSGEETWQPKSETDDERIVDEVKEGEIYLSTDKGGRKATGSYYTPQYVVEYIVENTLGPIVEDLRDRAWKKEDSGEWFANQIFDLDVLDPAMGSGHFLVEATDYLASQIIQVKSETKEQDKEHDIHWARREVARRCIYGVDVTPLATELAKLSLWLETMAEEKPLTFLDHHLKTGNSLIGADMEELETLPNIEKKGESISKIDKDFEEAIDGLVERYQKIEEQPDDSLEDIKLKEEMYDVLKDNYLKIRFEELANVYLSTYFGNEVPEGEYNNLKNNIQDDKVWEKFRGKDWFKKAQKIAKEKDFFHWKVEYPEAFFNHKDGFDAVVGNPPYVDIKNLNKELTEYLKKVMETSYRRFDLYVCFMEKSLDILAEGGLNSMIVPEKFLKLPYGKSIREKLLENNILNFVDLIDKDVFPEAKVNNVIYIVKKSDYQKKEVSVYNLEDGDYIKSHSIDYSMLESLPNNVFKINLTPQQLETIERIQRNTIPLSEIYYVSYGCQTGNRDDFVYGEKEPNYKPYIQGENITRYSIKKSNLWLDYDPENLHRPAFPELFEQEKIVACQVSGNKGIIASIDTENYYSDVTTIIAIPYSGLTEVDDKTISRRGLVLTKEKIEKSKSYDIRIILGLINSWVSNFYFQKTISDDLHVHPNDLKKVRIPKKFRRRKKRDISERVEAMINLKDRYNRLNLDIQDYLGNYQMGNTLGNLYTPTSGLADTVLTETKTDRDNLKLGQVNFEEENGELILKASAKYKPENEDEFYNLDRWGYAESDLVPCMRFDVSEKMEALIREFVSLAVDEGGGFGGFRENATKTISILDRLENITLPELSDVEDGLEKYIENKEKAEKLEKDIEEIDNEIDAIVFDLYDLTRDEVVTVLDSLDTPREEKRDILEKFENLD